MSTATKLTCVEICASAGGMALGFERAGYEHLALVEIEPLRCQVLRKNRPEWPIHCADVKTWEWSGPRPDVLAGGVPCQPASRAGKRKLHLDERDLWGALPALIERVRPRAVCFENVPGCADNPNVRALSDWLNARGWGWTWWRLNAADFGVPQTRERWFFVAVEGMGILMAPGPTPTHSKDGNTLPKWISVEDALQGDYGVVSTLPPWLLKRIGGEEAAMVSGKNANKGFQCDPIGEHGFQTKKNASNGFMDRGPLSNMPTTKQTRTLDEPSFTLTKEMGRRHRIVMGTPKRETRETRETREPSFTLQAGNQRHRIVDGMEVWAMTERQLQRLQAFPDDWRGMTTDMIGDSVPPPMAEAVARRLAEILRLS